MVWGDLLDDVISFLFLKFIFDLLVTVVWYMSMWLVCRLDIRVDVQLYMEVFQFSSPLTKL